MLIDKYKNEITEKSIQNAKFHINIIANYILQYCKTHPDLSTQQAIENIEEEFVNNANEYFSTIQELGGSYIQINIINNLLKDDKLLKNEYLKLRNKTLQNDNNTYYNYDIKKSTKILLKQVLQIIRDTLKDNKIKISFEEEFNCLKGTLANLQPEIAEVQKNDNVKLLRFVVDYFDKYNIMEMLINEYNMQQTSLWLEELNYSKDSSTAKDGDLGVKSLLSEENLKNMSTEELSVLNLFWQNKFAKELYDIGFAYFAFKQLNLSANNINIDDEEIKNLLLKYSVLEKLSAKIYEQKINKKNYMYIIDNLSDEYETYFNSLFPDLNNNLHDDIEQSIDPILAMKNVYSIKSNLLCGIIINLKNNKKLKNWGYINDNDEGKTNTIKNKNKFLLISIDYPGFNRPVSIHIERELLQDIFMSSLQSSIIPIYEGNDDFCLNFEHLKTHLVLPLEKSHKVFLRNALKKKSLNFNNLILNHTIFLANQDKFPEHLKQEKNKKKVRVRKYVDLFTGEIFIEQGNKLISEDSNEKYER